LDWTNYLVGGAAFGVIAGCWEKIKTVAWRVANLFVQRVEINSEYAHNALVSYLVAGHKRSWYYDRIYGAWHEYQADGRYTLVPYEVFGCRNVIFWDGWRPFLFGNAQEGRARPEGGQQTTDATGYATRVYSTVTFLRGTVNVERLLTAACRQCDRLSWDATDDEERRRNRFAIHHVPGRGRDDDQHEGHGAGGLPWYQQPSYRLLAHDGQALGKNAARQGTALSHLIFPPRIKDLIREVEMWRNSRSWYRDRGIPWKRGWLLYGPPGTGKTALARAFAEDLNLPIYVFNLAELSNHELMKAWADMQVNVPCVALLEDFDNVFHGRENVSRRNMAMSLVISAPKADPSGGGDDDRPRTPLTFDCLLNCLDGVERSDGVFTIITTNDLSKIDPALGQPRKLPDGAVEFISTRPGRLDKAVELTYMEPADKRAMAWKILGDYPEEYAEMLDFVDRFPDLNETPAQFQERCAQIALACFWREKTPPARNRVFGPPVEWKVLWEKEQAGRA
jgi:hypothetical protein